MHNALRANLQLIINNLQLTNKMRIRTFFISIVAMLSLTTAKSYACGYYSVEDYFFNLFAQELINDPRYTSFLMTQELRFYESDAPRKNANIEEWQGYLGLSYDDSYYLVFTASRDNIRALINGNASDDKRLGFITKDFVTRHKQALLYIAYAKYLEPYMRITKGEVNDNGWWGGYSSEFPDKEEANKLDYNTVTTVLTRSWNAETDNELKLRYGYQLVRFAHYNRKYEEAVKYFDTYVEPLNFKPEMYYYALSQKAGAIRGLGNIIEANADFMRVFSHSSDLKQSAYSSIYLEYDSEVDFNTFMSNVKTDNERNDIYLLLGYKAFNNPLNEIRKIVATTPDAIQAKVLMVRAINSIERSIFPVDNFYHLYTGDSRYPVIGSNEAESFINEAMKLSSDIAGKAKDKNFWNMTSSYLSFQKKDFTAAKRHLDKVQTPDELYRKQKSALTALIEICEQPTITKAVEEKIFNNHIDLFLFNSETVNSTAEFVKNVIANRYFIQKDYAKSFLMTNKINAIEMNLQEGLLNDIEKFHNKKDKNNFEKLLAKSIQSDNYEINEYFKYLHGILCLTNNDLNAANGYFKSAKNDFRTVSANIFGYNIDNIFDEKEELVMRKAYINEFPSIKNYMSYKDITDVLIELEKTGRTTGEKAAKANYLIGNFYYNVSSTGYFRHYLRFDNNNSFWYSKYVQYIENEKESEYLYRYVVQDDINTLYIKYDLFPFFKNTTGIADSYLQKALQQTNDDELKSLTLFTLAKVDQIRIYANGNYNYDQRFYSRTYFEKLKALNNTSIVKELNRSCEYFNYYVNN